MKRYKIFVNLIMINKRLTEKIKNYIKYMDASLFIAL